MKKLRYNISGQEVKMSIDLSSVDSIIRSIVVYRQATNCNGHGCNSCILLMMHEDGDTNETCMTNQAANISPDKARILRHLIDTPEAWEEE